MELVGVTSSYIPLHFKWREQHIAQAHIHSNSAAAVAGMTILMIRMLLLSSLRSLSSVSEQKREHHQ